MRSPSSLWRTASKDRLRSFPLVEIVGVRRWIRLTPRSATDPFENFRKLKLLFMAKLKSRPEDFYVDEITDFAATDGDFALYQLEKHSIGTPEAINAMLKSWNLSRKRVEYGGLKDRHAITTQHVTIYKGPQSNLDDRSYSLHYLGQTDRHFGPKDILANRFGVCLRNIAEEDLPGLQARAELVRDHGVINYFDDQRFGSVGFDGHLIGLPWCLGDYERALYLMLAEPNSHDRGTEKEEKEILRSNWGDWQKCKDELSRSHRRSVITFLCDHPENFKRAVGLIRKDLRSIYLAAFQSALWNQWLSRILATLIPKESQATFESRIGNLVSIHRLEDDLKPLLANMKLPLPSSRQKQWPEAYKPLLDELLSEYDLTTQKLRLKFPRDTFFSRGDRAVWVGGEDWSIESGDDEINESRKTLTLEFQLPRGAYATMLIRSVTDEE